MAAPTLSEWLRVCGADGASGQADQGLRLLSSPRTATGVGVRAERKKAGVGQRERRRGAQRKSKRINRALNTFSKSLLSLFSTLPLPHESNSSSFRGSGGSFSAKLLLFQSIATIFRIALNSAQNIVKIHIL